ncbi:MAG: ornithine carbamoyltransferase [Actinobacteria bacterium]|nr:ornithine carbamoyltransferase [Actinomycetota bacterium]MCL6104094.1 ornithine carbamoyltransferase [Actinomycetota bacterium]
MVRHLLDLDQLSPEELTQILDLSQKKELPAILKGHGVALLFGKPSLRTRNAAEMAVYSLGGHPVSIRGEEVGLDVRESDRDIARSLECYHTIVAARVNDHRILMHMAEVLQRASVLNLLSDVAHPTQALADLLTIKEHFGSLSGVKLAYIGDANNVCRSLLIGAALSGMHMSVASPLGYGLDHKWLGKLEVLLGRPTNSWLYETQDPIKAVEGSNAVYTDVWVSMGQEHESGIRKSAFEGYQLNTPLLANAGDDAVVLHCLPAHRGEEITSELLDSSRSLVWTQAANRMRAMRGLLFWLTETAGAGGQ